MANVAKRSFWRRVPALLAALAVTGALLPAVLAGEPIYDGSFDVADAPVTITAPGSYRVYSTAETGNTITVDVPDGAVTLLLDGVQIKLPSTTTKPMIDLKGSPAVAVVLRGENRLNIDHVSGTSGTAVGIRVGPDAGLTVRCAAGDSCPCRTGGSCANKLSIAMRYSIGAAIGGMGSSTMYQAAESCGRVTVEGGTLQLQAEKYIIGGGSPTKRYTAGGSGGAVRILGGHIAGSGAIGGGDGESYPSGVTAGSFYMADGYLQLSSNSPRATIGAGFSDLWGAVSNPELRPDITITGGTLDIANTGSGCAIGGGDAGGRVAISGGTVTASSAYQPAIGGLCTDSASYSPYQYTRGGGVDIAITGGTVNARTAAWVRDDYGMFTLFASNAPAIGDLGGGQVSVSGGIVSAVTESASCDDLYLGYQHGGGEAALLAGDIAITGGLVAVSDETGDTLDDLPGFTAGIALRGGQGQVRGNASLPGNYTLAAGNTLTVQPQAILAIAANTTLTVEGTLQNRGLITGGGTLENRGLVESSGLIGGGTAVAGNAVVHQNGSLKSDRTALTTARATYCGAPFTLPGGVQWMSGDGAEACTVTWSADREGSEPLDGAPVDAGTYYARVSVPVTAAYNSAEAVVPVTISPRPVAVLWGDTTLAYTGGYIAPSASADTGIAGETVTLTVNGGAQSPGQHTATALISSPNRGNFALQNSRVDFVITAAAEPPAKVPSSDADAAGGDHLAAGGGDSSSPGTGDGRGQLVGLGALVLTAAGLAITARRRAPRG